MRSGSTSDPDAAMAAEGGFETRRDKVAREFWAKTRRVAAKLPFAEDLVAAYYCAFDRETPRHVQITLIGALAYFIMPADAMPDIVPLLGFGDDALALGAAIRLVAAHITPDHRAAAREHLARIAG